MIRVSHTIDEAGRGKRDMEWGMWEMEWGKWEAERGKVQGWGRLKARTRKSGGSSEKGGKQGLRRRKKITR